MLKKLKHHTIYEVWNEWAAESVFVDHKPTKKELWELVLNTTISWSTAFARCESVDDFISKYIHVKRETQIYTKA